jgi:hypothetical protein
MMTKLVARTIEGQFRAKTVQQRRHLPRSRWKNRRLSQNTAGISPEEHPPRRRKTSPDTDKHIMRYRYASIWVRAPKRGQEFYSGCSRPKLYE